MSFLKKIKNWESWPFAVLYAPIAPVWLWYTLKSRSFWFFTNSNPKIEFGGMIGEAKMPIYNLLPTNLYPTTRLIKAGINFDEVEKIFEETQLNFPIILKPDVSEQALLMRKIDSIEQWKLYHQNCTVDYLLQQLCPYKTEVSVFYVRKPSEVKGRITGFIKKVPMHVVGDGVNNLEYLIKNHHKAEKYAADMLVKHNENLNYVPQKDEVYFLTIAGNHNRGAQFYDLSKYINSDFTNKFDELSKNADDLFYGRYDILCQSVEDLLAWKNFHILEYNGCGAEPNHFYDTGYTLGGAYKVITSHWKYLYEICYENRKKGIKPWRFSAGYKFLKKAKENLKHLSLLEKSIPQ